MSVETVRADYFPHELVTSIRAVAAAPADFWPATSPLAAELFTPLQQLGNYERPETRRGENALTPFARAIHKEHFLFLNEVDEPVGWSFGHMHDSETFFMSWSGVARAYQKRGIYGAFVRRLLPYLEGLGYERVSSNHMLNNRPVLIAKLKAGFNITSVTMDERYGAQATLTYFCHEDRQQGFETAFSLEVTKKRPVGNTGRSQKFTL